MDMQKVVKVTRKLAAIVNREFPFISQDEARETLLKALLELHIEPKIWPQLFADVWGQLPVPLKNKNNDDDLV